MDTTVDLTKRYFKLYLREVSGEKRMHVQAVNANDMDDAKRIGNEWPDKTLEFQEAIEVNSATGISLK